MSKNHDAEIRSTPEGSRRHASRIDLDRYEAKVRSPATARPLTVAVIGAGLSGLVCARTLVDHGHRVTVFEKARGVGGRMSTRRADALRFDHGAQYFTVRDARFRRLVDAWRHDGVVQPWDGTIVTLDGKGDYTEKDRHSDRFVAVPGMNGIAKHLAKEVDVALRTRITSITREGASWRLASDDEDLGYFDAVVVSAPAPQAHALLVDAAPDLAARIAEASMAPCWAVMVHFGDEGAASSIDLDFAGAFVDSSPLSWIARNDSKPGRPGPHDPDAHSWVLHASPAWSEANLEREPETVAEELLAAFFQATGMTPCDPDHVAAHRWRYALPTAVLSDAVLSDAVLPDACLFDADRWIGACGDWCAGPRVEGAFLSGAAIAGRVLSICPSGGQVSLFGSEGA